MIAGAPKILRRQTAGLFCAFIAAAMLPAAMGQQSPQPQPQPPQQQQGLDASLAIRSSLLERFVADSRTEEQPVSKTLLRSDVTGCQTTITDSRLRIVPNSRPLQFEIQTTGRVRSQTTGVNPDAIVESLGTHQFQVIKPFWFDGLNLKTQRSHGVIQAWQSPQKVLSTAGARMPILAPLTNQIAWDRVRRMQPQINQVVAEDLSREILPKVDRTVEQEFIELDQNWRRARQRLSLLFSQSDPEWTAAALEQTVQLSVTGSPDASRQTADPIRLQSDEDIVASISADSLSHLVCSSLPGGMRLADTQLQQASGLLPDLLSRQPDAMTKLTGILSEPTAPTFFTVELPTVRPFEFRCINGDLQLLLRFRIQPLIGVSSGWMSATVSLRGRQLSHDSWTVAVRSVEVNPADDAEVAGGGEASPRSQPNAAGETIRAGTVWPTLVQSRLQTLLESADPPAFPREFSLPIRGRQAIRLHLHSVDARDGRLQVALRAARAQQAPLAKSQRAVSPNDNRTGR